jgi:hypothetical protein
MRPSIAACILSVLLTLPALAQPLTSAFTYQGELTDSNLPTNGGYDFQFALLDSAAGPTQVGPTLCADNVAVVNGRFTVSLDFGAQFAGQTRYLEVRVRPDTGLDCATTTGFTALSPRTNLTAAPNALYSLNTTLLDNRPSSFYSSASNLTSGTLAIERGGTSANTASAARTALAVPGLADSNTFTNFNLFASGATIQTPSIGTTPLTVAVPSGQTADLQSWNVSGVPLARVLANGAIVSNFYISSANQVIAPAFNYPTPQQRSYSLSAADFSPTTDGILFDKSTSQGLSAPVQAGTLNFMAPVHLPDGASVTSLTAYVVDSYASGNITVELSLRFHGSTSTGGSSATSTGSAGAQTLVINPGVFVIDNDAHSHFIRVIWPGAAGTTIQLRDIKINYTVSTPLP